MHNQNEAFLHLNDALPADIARRRDMGDLAGALRLIDARLSSGVQPLLAPRLEAERLRLTRLPYDYPYTRPEAVALVRAEWPGFTEAQFDALLDGGRIDWRMVDGELRVHREFLESLRITIARAMLKQASVIILDEATAYADPENEALIQQAISKLVVGKSLIVVAHRLNTIRNADQILVVANGEIVGRGIQEELLQSCPLYRKMWQDYTGSTEGGAEDV